MKYRFASLAVGLVAAMCSAPALAVTYQTAADFNLFVIGNATVQGSDTEGRVAVGGNATFQPYTVNMTGAQSGTNLVVGGNLTSTGGSIRGDVAVGGNAQINQTGSIGNITANGSVSVSNTTVTGNVSAGTTATKSGASVGGTMKSNQAASTLPVDFAAEAVRLPALSTMLAGYAQTGTVSSVTYGSHGSQITLTAKTTGLNVFNIDGSLFTNTNTFTINLLAGSSALINVSGTSGTYYNAGMTVNGGTASNVLFNFSQATSLNFYGTTITGSVLAPKAAYTPTGYGSVNGQLIVNSFSGSYSGGATQVNNYTFSGGNPGGAASANNLLRLAVRTTPTGSVPEPASWATMILGFGVIGAAMRRRRVGTVAATR